MASGSLIVKLSLAATFLCIVIGGRVTEAAISCDQVVSNLYPCLAYVNGGGGPSLACCNGVKNLNTMAQTTPDRQAVCRCLESLIKGVPYNSRNVNNAAQLPSKCNIKLPYAISPNVDCNTIRM